MRELSKVCVWREGGRSSLTSVAQDSFHFLSSHRLRSLILGSADGKESACNAGDLDSVPGLGRSPGIATHSSIIAGEFHGQSMGLQRVGHDCATNTHTRSLILLLYPTMSAGANTDSQEQQDQVLTRPRMRKHPGNKLHSLHNVSTSSTVYTVHI